jgi:tRNA-Thr(GGU) m(6)t(6)A37 methyltransferase TsaA
MTEQDKTYQIRPIGTVRHAEGGFRLEILEPYRPALRHLDQFTHVMVFWWAHKLDNEKDRSVMQADLPYAPGVRAGVFACRAEYRPNPIAMTTCFIVDVDEEKGLVQLAWIDAFDGTPLVDLKPYIPMADRIRDVDVAEWLKDWPEWMEDAAEFFAQADVDFG